MNKKIAFIGNSEPPEKLLELFRKFTPGKSGIWGQLKGVNNYQDADYFGVIDYIPDNIRNQIDETRCIFLGAHPETMQAYRDMSNYKGIKMYDLKHAFGYGEWWLKYDYDYLMKLSPNPKLKLLGAIVSDANTQEYHKKRREFLERFTNRNDIEFDLYGRIRPFTENMKKYYRGVCGSLDARGAASANGNDHMSGKEEIYNKYKYMIEFDATGKNYFSERVFDCLLMWSMPIYYGGYNLDKYLPKECFVQLDINGNGDDIIKIINSGIYEKSLPYIAKARQLLLNKYHIFARCHDAIFGEQK